MCLLGEFNQQLVDIVSRAGGVRMVDDNGQPIGEIILSTVKGLFVAYESDGYSPLEVESIRMNCQTGQTYFVVDNKTVRIDAPFIGSIQELRAFKFEMEQLSALKGTP